MVRPKFVHHAARRGDLHPPSSLSGLADCLAAGASIIEVDVAPLADGGFALVHDARLERISEGKGLVPAATSAEIQGLHHRWHQRIDDPLIDPPLTDEPLGLLSEAVSLIEKYPSMAELQLDLKPFRPLTDVRLSWFNVLGTGGVRELLWLERTEGYIGTFLDNYPFIDGDTLVIYSHGGLNAAGIDAALYARERGVPVVAVTSVQNLALNAATHSSGKRLAEVADIVIDNACLPADAVVEIEGWGPPVGATSTLSVVLISMALTSELAASLAARGITLPTFVSPNDVRFGPDHNSGVFEEYRRRTRR